VLVDDQVLSLDGGGIRGMVLIQLLQAIEQVAGQPIRNCFDWIGGTSTGAILSLAIVHGLLLRLLIRVAVCRVLQSADLFLQRFILDTKMRKTMFDILTPYVTQTDSHLTASLLGHPGKPAPERLNQSGF